MSPREQTSNAKTATNDWNGAPIATWIDFERPTEAPNRGDRRVLRVRTKYILSLSIAAAWATLSYFLAVKWISELSTVFGGPLADIMVFSIAIIPGFMNAFITAGLLFDRRPKREALSTYPGLSILVAAYNEEDSILSTLDSIERQNYPGPLEVFVINDGSTDGTMDRLRTASYPWLQVIDMKKNGGKAKALNAGLERVHFDLTITLDGDSLLYRDALVRIVGRLISDPPHTASVAGTVLVRNSRINMVTKIQEWDYFHGIAAIKRLQSLFQGTLVAQGAFSLYRTSVLHEAGGWADCVGEDIVLTWAMLKKGYRVGYCEDSLVFTNAPTTWRQFIRQRQRWSRGLIEAFRVHGQLLFHWRMSTIFIWWNLLFPLMDLAYTLFFVPGLVLALFGIYWIAGPMTLLVLPLAMTLNYLMFLIQASMFTQQGLRVRKNVVGFLCYALLYGLILQPACVAGYAMEVVGWRKSWGTK
jgi:biofilm PGA synthesis N-glycosyltransferase PgaC